jgi:hypothetical protein
MAQFYDPLVIAGILKYDDVFGAFFDPNSMEEAPFY